MTMNFGGHFLSGWLLGWAAPQSTMPERRAITLAAIAPDIDGIFTFVPGFGHLHRTFGHNIWFIIILSLFFLGFLNSSDRKRLFPFIIAALLLHYAMDIFITGWWPFIPLWPFSEYTFYMDRYIPQHIMEYYFQLSLLILLFIPTLMLIRQHYRTPLEIISINLDTFILRFTTLPWTHRCAYCKSPAFYTCNSCGRMLCGHHRKIQPQFKVICYPDCRG